MEKNACLIVSGNESRKAPNNVLFYFLGLLYDENLYEAVIAIQSTTIAPTTIINATTTV